MTDAFEPDEPELGGDQLGDGPDDPDPPDEADGTRTGLIIGGIVAVLVLGLAGLFLLTRDNGSPTVSSQDTLPGTTTAPSTTRAAGGAGTTAVKTGTTRSGSVSTTTTTISSSSTSTTTPSSTTRAPTTSSPATTTTTAGAKPTIVTFSVPATVTAAQCGNRGNTEVVLSWDTRGATSVSLTSDGAPYQSGLPAKGSTTVNYGCLEGQHTYGITAVGADGSTATDSRTVTGPPKSGT